MKPIDSFLGELQGIIDKEDSIVKQLKQTLQCIERTFPDDLELKRDFKTKLDSEVVTIQEKCNVGIRQLLFRHMTAECYVYAVSLKLNREQLSDVIEDCVSKINVDDIRKHPVEAYNWAVSAVNEALNSLFENQCKDTRKEEEAVAYLKSLGYTVGKPANNEQRVHKMYSKETEEALKLLSSLADMGLF